MKKAMMLFAALTLSTANADRTANEPSNASTNLIFNTTVVPGCAVNLAPSYTSQTGTYNGTDGNPEVLSLSAQGEGFGEGAATPMLRCQTGTGVTFGVNQQTAGFAANMMDSPWESSVSFSGDMSLRLNNGLSNDDNKRLDGQYTVTINKYNIATGNGDTYGMTASFTPRQGWFEAMVGEYTGTLTLNVDY